MKISVSLSEHDLAYLDDYSRRQAGSRSSAVHRAIALLRASELEDAYEMAWDEWDESTDARLWDQTAADGMSHAER